MHVFWLQFHSTSFLKIIVGSGDGLAQKRQYAIPVPMLTKIYYATWHRKGTVS